MGQTGTVTMDNLHQLCVYNVPVLRVCTSKHVHRLSAPTRHVSSYTAGSISRKEKHDEEGVPSSCRTRPQVHPASSDDRGTTDLPAQ